MMQFEDVYCLGYEEKANLENKGLVFEIGTFQPFWATTKEDAFKKCVLLDKDYPEFKHIVLKLTKETFE